VRCALNYSAAPTELFPEYRLLQSDTIKRILYQRYHFKADFDGLLKISIELICFPV